MPSYRPISFRRATAAALAGAMLLSLLPAAATLAGSMPPGSVEAAEWSVLSQMNDLRERNGLKPLRMAESIRGVARARSQSMRAKDYFAHSSPTGVDAGDLLARRDIQHFYWGENIGWTRYMDAASGSSWMVDWWRNSPGHRWNILYKGYNYAGVGIVADGPLLLYTVVFAAQQDHTPPVAGMVTSQPVMALAGTEPTRSVTVRWWGKDRKLSTRTSGLRGFTVAYKRGDGDWRTLRRMTKTRSLTLELPKGTHAFRVRATDKQGNKGAWRRPLVVTVD